MKASRKLMALAAALALTPALAQAQRPVVAELFTSQGCSSCPPADALLTELARSRPDVLVLAFHVTYWDNLGWRDPFSLPEATERQRGYASRFSDGTVYTPQLVVEGRVGLVGSDRPAVEGALRQAAETLAAPAPLRLTRQGDTLLVEVGAAARPVRATLLLVGYDPSRRTAVGRGENGGRTLLESNVVRSVVSLGDWSGSALALRAQSPAGAEAAVLLQAADGRILGAARLDGASS